MGTKHKHKEHNALDSPLWGHAVLALMATSVKLMQADTHCKHT